MLVNDGEILVNDGDEHFTIISLKYTIIRAFDHHWEAAPTAGGGRAKQDKQVRDTNLRKNVFATYPYFLIQLAFINKK